MNTRYENGNVIAFCPNCNSTTTFESKSTRGEYGSFVLDSHPMESGWDLPHDTYRIVFVLLRCAGCGRAGLAAIACGNTVVDGELQEFFPYSIETAPLPDSVPDGIQNEFREAETDASIGSYRSASSMLRSTLEKTLKDHGYETGNLQQKIDEATKDGIITLPLKRRAHENVRVLGNNILHDEWRKVESTEYEESHEYTKRILECFYDDPESVKKILEEKNGEKSNNNPPAS